MFSDFNIFLKVLAAQYEAQGLGILKHRFLFWYFERTARMFKTISNIDPKFNFSSKKM